MGLGMCLVVDKKEMAIQGAWLSLRWDLQTDLGSDGINAFSKYIW